MLDGAAKEADRGGGLFVSKDFDVGQAGGVVDRDVHELPALLVAALMVTASALAPEDSVSGPGDPSELFDVDVDQFAWALTLVALRGLRAKTPELAHPEPGQDP